MTDDLLKHRGHGRVSEDNTISWLRSYGKENRHWEVADRLELLEAQLAEARNDALEEAAKVFDRRAGAACFSVGYVRMTSIACAAAIRALKEPKP